MSKRRGLLLVCDNQKKEKKASSLETHLDAIRDIFSGIDGENKEPRVEELEAHVLILQQNNIVLRERNRTLKDINVGNQRIDHEIQQARLALEREKAENVKLTQMINVLDGLVNLTRLPGPCVNCNKQGDGLICTGPGAHGICFGCLGDFASMDAATEDYMYINAAGDLIIHCTVCVLQNCGWNVHSALKHAEGESHKLFLGACLRHAAHTQYCAEKMAIASANTEVASAKKSIFKMIEKLSAQECPGGCPWVDHEGCLMLRCKCGVQFCGLCDAFLPPAMNGHEHVRNCAANPEKGTVYMEPTEFKVLKKAQRYERVNQFLATLDERFLSENATDIFERVHNILE